jgi:membrane-associated protein
MHPAFFVLGPSWLDAQYLLHQLGPWALWGAAAIVFAECGLLLGFFLPGDSLLFTVGLLVSTGVIHHQLWLACLVLVISAFAGNVVGYEIGRASGPAIFRKEDSRLFKKAYVDKTVHFFDTYGSRAIVLARFVPIVRTFITVTAGVGRMDRRRYLTFSGIGALLWAVGVTVLGYFLGQIQFVQKNIELILIAIVFVSVIPVGIEYLRGRARSRTAASFPGNGSGHDEQAEPRVQSSGTGRHTGR